MVKTFYPPARICPVEITMCKPKSFFCFYFQSHLKKPLLVISLLLGYTVLAQAQVFFDRASVTISKDATFYIIGSLELNNNTRVNNEGQIIITDNWINNSDPGIFGQSSGAVILKNGDHLIGGNSPTLFHTLQISDSGLTSLDTSCFTGGYYKNGILAIGKNTVVLNENYLHITNPMPGALKFSSGYFTSGGPGSSAAIKWNIDSIQGQRLIPFGTLAGIQIPIRYELMSGDAGTVSFSTYPVKKLTPLNFGDSLNQAMQGRIARFWQISGDGKTGISALSFVYSAEDGDTSLKADFLLAGKTDTSRYWECISKPDPAIDYRMWPVSTMYSSFTLVSIGSESRTACGLTFFAFPINEGKAVVSRWITNACYADVLYEVERSADGIHYKKTDVVNAGEEIKTNHTYESKDLSPLAGNSWYRVKKFLEDGSSEYSEAAKVFFNTPDEIEVTFYPNPVHGLAHLKINAGELSFNDMFLQVFDAIGKTIFSKNITEMSQPDVHLFEFDCTFMMPGLYAFKLHNHNKVLKVGNFIVR